MKLNRLLQYTDGFVRVRDLKRKGISFVRTEAISGDYSGSSESSTYKNSRCDVSSVGKLRKPRSSLFEERLSSVGNFPCNAGQAMKQQTHKHPRISRHGADHSNYDYKSKERRNKHTRESSTQITCGQAKQSYDEGDKELHLPPIVIEEDKDSKIQGVSSNEVCESEYIMILHLVYLLRKMNKIKTDISI